MKSYISRKLPLATRNTVLIFCLRSAGDSIWHSPWRGTRTRRTPGAARGTSLASVLARSECRAHAGSQESRGALRGAYLASVLGVCSPHVAYGAEAEEPVVEVVVTGTRLGSANATFAPVPTRWNNGGGTVRVQHRTMLTLDTANGHAPATDSTMRPLHGSAAHG